MTEEELQNEKNVAFYAASVEAWLNTSLEYDKSIFALSAGGIGLLITLLTTIGAPSIAILWFYGLGIVCFIASLIMLLVIFRRNRKHIEEVLAANEVVEDLVLKRLDLAVLCAFGAAAVFTATVGVMSAIDSYETKSKEPRDKEKTVANEKKGQYTTGNVSNESFNGMSNLTKSFNGLSNVRPQASTSTQNPTPASQPSSASTPSVPAASNENRQQR
jgi:hypothetical protein